MLRSGLALWCYTLGQGGVTPALRNYASEADSLTFTTVAPGGFGTLTATLLLANPRIPRPELGLFARVALMAGIQCLFVGEMMEPVLQMDGKGESVQISALGLGNALRDDPTNTAYTLQTAAQIMANQYTIRSSYLPLDSDFTGVYPDAPTATYSPTYLNRTMEEVVSDVAILAGDYHWGVWGHPRNRDSAGFPTAQLLVHQRDTSTVGYQASVNGGDVTAYKISPSSDRAYNVLEIDYYDPVGNAVGTASYTDPRIAANTAPFRRRKLMKDLSGMVTVNGTQAQAIANTYGLQYSNITNKVSVTLNALHDGAGAELPLWLAQADRNILIPELMTRATNLMAGTQAGSNLFYIVQTSYKESSSGIQLDLDCDNFLDQTEVAIARLQLASDYQQRAQRTMGSVQAKGATETGVAGGILAATAAGQTVGTVHAFRATMTTAPTSITLVALQTANITGSATVSNITIQGFTVSWVATAAGSTTWYGEYQTVGN